MSCQNKGQGHDKVLAGKDNDRHAPSTNKMLKGSTLINKKITLITKNCI